MSVLHAPPKSQHSPLLPHHVIRCSFYLGRLRSGSGSAQVYSLCSLRCGRVKRNCQLLTSSKIGSMGAKTLSLCLPACLMLVPIYIVGRCLVCLILRIYVSLAGDNSDKWPISLIPQYPISPLSSMPRLYFIPFSRSIHLSEY
jgi:hypothetical protein